VKAAAAAAAAAAALDIQDSASEERA